MKKKTLLLGLLLFALAACDSPQVPPTSEPSEPESSEPESSEPESSEPESSEPESSEPESSEPSTPDTPIDPEETDLDEYTITYLKDDKGAGYAAKELSSKLEKLEITLNVNELESYTNTSKNLHFTTDDSLVSSYTISNDVNNVVFKSSNAVGLISAAKNFVETLKANTTGVNTWYSTPVNKQYNQQEKLKVMTFNVRQVDDGTRPNGDTANIADRTPRVIKCINTYTPDVIGFQECNDKWFTNLINGLAPQYGHIGYGREKTYKGEGTPIFYNRDTVTLLEGGTKWLSETPEVAGSKLSTAGYLRVFTYGIFKRHSDGFIFMHINTHTDTGATTSKQARMEELRIIQEFSDPYKDLMPIYVTADFNCHKTTENDIISSMILDHGYVDVVEEALDCTEHYTFSQEGYNDPGSQVTIDYLMKKNRGLYFTKYYVDTAKYSGDGIEKPQVTSDHYPIYFEAIPYTPLVEFDAYDTVEDVEIDNGFAAHDKDYNLVKHYSKYSKVAALCASKATFTGTFVPAKTNKTQYASVGNMSSSANNEITYKFDSAAAGKADLVLTIANNLVTAASHGIKNLQEHVTLTLNNQAIDLTNIDLRCTDIRQLYEWENLVLHNVNLVKGENTLKMAAKASVCPDHLLLEIFSNNDVTQIVDTDSELDNTNSIKIGGKTYSITQFNKTYTTQESHVSLGDDGLTLTMTIKEGQTVDISGISGLVDLRTYNTVIFTGKGTINFTMNADSDCLYVNNLVVAEGTTLNVIGKDKTLKTGMKCWDTLQVDGTYTITNFLYAFGGWSEMTKKVSINVGAKGTFDINNSAWGIFLSEKSQGASFNIAGNLNVDVDNDCLKSMNGASTFTFLGNSITTLKSSTGTGIWATASWNTSPTTANSGSVALRDNAKVEINTADSPIFGVKSLIIANGDAANSTVNTASLIVNTKGTTKGAASNNTSGTKDSNAVEFTPDATFVTHTTGKVSITGTENTLSKTCLRFYGGAVKVIIKCVDFSISGYQNAMGTWHAWSNPSFTYEYTGSYAKMNVNAKLIYNTSFAANTAVLGPIFNEDTVNFTKITA